MEYGYDDEIKQAILDVLDDGHDGLHVWVFDECEINGYSTAQAMGHRLEFVDKVLAKLHPPTALERGEDVDVVIDRFIKSCGGAFDSVDTQEYMDDVRGRE